MVRSMSDERRGVSKHENENEIKREEVVFHTT